jgi:hypothetical protein
MDLQNGNKMYGVSYIMYFNKIKFTDRWCFMGSGISIATHTNEVK